MPGPLLKGILCTCPCSGETFQTTDLDNFGNDRFMCFTDTYEFVSMYC